MRKAHASRYQCRGWFRTTSPLGGQIAGFGSSIGTGTSTTVDRVVWLGISGKLNFGVGTTTRTTITTPTAGFNDGNWHHVVATMGPAGTALYVDGTLRVTGTTTTGPSYVGYWRFGGDSGLSWPDTASGWGYFTGDLDEPDLQRPAHRTGRVRALPRLPGQAHSDAGTGAAPARSASWA